MDASHKCRDPRGDYSELTESIDRGAELFIRSRQDKLKVWGENGLHPGNILDNKFRWFEDEVRIIERKYARGDALESLVPDVEHAIKTLSAVYAEASEYDEQYDSQGDDRICDVNISTLFYALRFALFAACLITDSALKRRFGNSFLEKEDKLLDLVMAEFSPEREITESGVKYPDAIEHPDYMDFSLLRDMIRETEQERQILVKEYLEKYKKNMKDHTPYWSFELALIMKLFNFDDSYLEGHPHYPWELVKYKA